MEIEVEHAFLRRNRRVSQAAIGPPVHQPRLARERVEEVPAAPELHAEFLHSGDRAVPPDLRLARIGEAMTEPTGEEGAVPGVQFRSARLPQPSHRNQRRAPRQSQPKSRGGGLVGLSGERRESHGKNI